VGKREHDVEICCPEPDCEHDCSVPPESVPVWRAILRRA
jgi:hypothetical protein